MFVLLRLLSLNEKYNDITTFDLLFNTIVTLSHFGGYGHLEYLFVVIFEEINVLPGIVEGFSLDEVHSLVDGSRVLLIHLSFLGNISQVK